MEIALYFGPVRILILFGFLLFASETPPEPLTLEALYYLALRGDENVELSALQTLEARERLSQAKATLLPKVSLVASHARQDVPDTSSTISADQTQAKIGVVQPVFRGFAEYRALIASREAVELKALAESHSKVVLFGRVAEAFFQALSAEKDLENLKNTFELSLKRNKELGLQVRSGRSRSSDLIAGESQLAQLEAQVAAGEALSFKRRLELFDRARVEKNENVKLDRRLKPIRLEPAEAYALNLSTRPDLEGLNRAIRISEEEIAIGQGGHWPSVDIGANYYLARSGTLADSIWDVGVTAALPIFSGGAVASSVREANLRYLRAKIESTRSKREALTRIKSLHGGVESGLIEERALTRAVDLAKKNFEALSRDYRFSQASNMDVISALGQLGDVQRNLDKLIYQNQERYHELLVTSGRIVTTQGRP